MDRVSKSVKNFFEFCRKSRIGALAMMLAVTALFASSANAQPTFSGDLGVDTISSYIPLVAGYVGGTIVAALSLYFLVLAIKVSIRWVRGWGAAR